MDGILMASSGNHWHGKSIKRATGAHRIASFLRQHGYEIDVLDYATYFSEEELYDYLLKNITAKTKFIGFSGTFFIAFPKLINVSKRIKKKYPNLKIVTGSQVFEQTAAIHADYFVVGYGEYAILSILEDKEIKSTVKPFDGKSKHVIYALHDYPAFPMKDLSIDHVESDYIQPNELLTLECARGCIFKCKFCSYPILGVRDDHTIDPQNFEDNLKRNYDNWGITNYNLADETFNDYPEKIKKYADVVEKLPFKVNFGGYIRADLMCNEKRDDVEHLARMNFNSHFYGIESFNYDSAKAIGKGGDPKFMQDRILEIEQYFNDQVGFYHGHMSFIVGLPYETQESLDDTLSWVDRNWQKNSIDIHPLFINHYSRSDTQSLLSKDYKKYGYEEVNIDDIWKDEPSDIEVKDNNIKMYADNLRTKPEHDFGLIWDTGHFNLYTASKVSADWYAENKHKHGETPFHFNEWTGNGYNYEDLHASYEELGGLEPLKEKTEKFFENYKSKKLY